MSLNLEDWSFPGSLIRAKNFFFPSGVIALRIQQSCEIKSSIPQSIEKDAEA